MASLRVGKLKLDRGAGAAAAKTFCLPVSLENKHHVIRRKHAQRVTTSYLSDANSSTFENESMDGKTEPGTEKEEMEEPGLHPPALVCPCLN